MSRFDLQLRKYTGLLAYFDDIFQQIDVERLVISLGFDILLTTTKDNCRHQRGLANGDGWRKRLDMLGAKAQQCDT